MSSVSASWDCLKDDDDDVCVCVCARACVVCVEISLCHIDPLGLYLQYTLGLNSTFCHIDFFITKIYLLDDIQSNLLQFWQVSVICLNIYRHIGNPHLKVKSLLWFYMQAFKYNELYTFSYSASLHILILKSNYTKLDNIYLILLFN